MRENRTYGSEGGAAEPNRPSLPLSAVSGAPLSRNRAHASEAVNGVGRKLNQANQAEICVILQQLLDCAVAKKNRRGGEQLVLLIPASPVYVGSRCFRPSGGVPSLFRKGHSISGMSPDAIPTNV